LLVLKNIILSTSKFILKEEASKRIILGTVIIIVGSSLAVWFGDHSTEGMSAGVFQVLIDDFFFSL
jgi:drug/metabolite transporter (DMT)-like permease